MPDDARHADALLPDLQASSGRDKRMAADVASSMGFPQRYTIYDARISPNSGLKDAKRAYRCEYVVILDRDAKDKRYAVRMDLAGISTETIQEREALYEKRERSPLPAHSVPYDQRQWKYARWGCRSKEVGGRNTALHHWNY